MITRAFCRETKQEVTSSTSAASRWKQLFSNAGWKSYLSQESALAAFSMTLLYLTVLSLGLLMTAFLNWKGMSEAELSIYRGLGAVSGLAATLAFPVLQNRIGEHSPRLCRPYDNNLVGGLTLNLCKQPKSADAFHIPAAANFIEHAKVKAACLFWLN